MDTNTIAANTVQQNCNQLFHNSTLQRYVKSAEEEPLSGS